jgi:hypothetical protein
LDYALRNPIAAATAVAAASSRPNPGTENSQPNPGIENSQQKSANHVVPTEGAAKTNVESTEAMSFLHRIT